MGYEISFVIFHLSNFINLLTAPGHVSKLYRSSTNYITNITFICDELCNLISSTISLQADTMNRPVMVVNVNLKLNQLI